MSPYRPQAIGGAHKICSCVLSLAAHSFDHHRKSLAPFIAAGNVQSCVGAMARVWMALGLLPLARAFVGAPAAGLQGVLASRRSDARVAVRGGVRAKSRKKYKD